MSDLACEEVVGEEQTKLIELLLEEEPGFDLLIKPEGFMYLLVGQHFGVADWNHHIFRIPIGAYEFYFTHSRMKLTKDGLFIGLESFEETEQFFPFIPRLVQDHNSTVRESMPTLMEPIHGRLVEPAEKADKTAGPITELKSKAREKAQSKREQPPDSRPPCPHCGSHDVTKHGTRNTKNGVANRYQCTCCNKRFTATEGEDTPQLERGRPSSGLDLGNRIDIWHNVPIHQKVVDSITKQIARKEMVAYGSARLLRSIIRGFYGTKLTMNSVMTYAVSYRKWVIEHADALYPQDTTPERVTKEPVAAESDAKRPLDSLNLPPEQQALLERLPLDDKAATNKDRKVLRELERMKIVKCTRYPEVDSFIPFIWELAEGLEEYYQAEPEGAQE